jgi:hypothetical protein
MTKKKRLRIEMLEKELCDLKKKYDEEKKHHNQTKHDLDGALKEWRVTMEQNQLLSSHFQFTLKKILDRVGGWGWKYASEFSKFGIFTDVDRFIDVIGRLMDEKVFMLRQKDAYIRLFKQEMGRWYYGNKKPQCTFTIAGDNGEKLKYEIPRDVLRHILELCPDNVVRLVCKDWYALIHERPIKRYYITKSIGMDTWVARQNIYASGAQICVWGRNECGWLMFDPDNAMLFDSEGDAVDYRNKRLCKYPDFESRNTPWTSYSIKIYRGPVPYIDRDRLDDAFWTACDIALKILLEEKDGHQLIEMPSSWQTYYVYFCGKKIPKSEHALFCICIQMHEYNKLAEYLKICETRTPPSDADEYYNSVKQWDFGNVIFDKTGELRILNQRCSWQPLLKENRKVRFVSCKDVMRIPYLMSKEEKAEDNKKVIARVFDITGASIRNYDSDSDSDGSISSVDSYDKYFEHRIRIVTEKMGPALMEFAISLVSSFDKMCGSSGNGRDPFKQVNPKSHGERVKRRPPKQKRRLPQVNRRLPKPEQYTRRRHNHDRQLRRDTRHQQRRGGRIQHCLRQRVQCDRK